MDIKHLIKPSFVLMAAVGLSACGGNSSDVRKVDCSDCAVITSIAADFGSSAIDFVETTFPYAVQTGFAKQDLSDIRAVTYGDHFYRLGRFQQDNISKWSFENGNAAVWEFSLGEGANPYDVIFVSETKAYALLWGASEIKVIDPSVTSNLEEAEFNNNDTTIDLSAYLQGNATNSTAAAAILDNGFLYVVLEGLDENFAPQTSHLIKINTSTDTEVDVNGSAEEGNGYALEVKNAGDLELSGNTIYVAGKGRYANNLSDPIRPVELTGGIEKVDISGTPFTSTLLVDDDTVGAQITNVEITNGTTGYFIRYNARQNSDLMKFNLSDGVVETLPVTNYAGKDIKFIEVDDNSQLWVGLGSATEPKIDILSTVDESLEGSIALTRNPAAIKFADTTN